MKDGVGKLLREIRESKKLTLEEVADAFGSDSGNLSRFETGNQGTTIQKFENLLAAYGIPLREVLRKAAGLASNATITTSPFRFPLLVGERRSPLQNHEWIEINPVMWTAIFAGQEMRLVRTSFESPEFELHFMGYLSAGHTELIGAQKAAPSFARDVLAYLANSI